MRRKKTNRFGIYSLFILLWLVVVTALSVIFISIFLDRFKNNIIALINENIPVNIKAEAIKHEFPLKLELVDVYVYSKENEDEFLSLNNVKLSINPIRLIFKRNFFYAIDYVEINDAWVYPASFDFSLFKKKDKKDDENKNGILDSIRETLHSINNKRISIKNINIGTSKKSAVSLGVSINNFDAVLNDTGYSFYSSMIFPDSTSLNMSAETPTNLSGITANISARDKNGILFMYDGKIENSNSVVDASIKNINGENILQMNYNPKEDRTYFNLDGINIKRSSVEKILTMIGDIKISESENSFLGAFGKNGNNSLIDSAKKNINSFVSASFSANGNYKKGEPLCMGFNAKALARDFNVDINLTLTNNNIDIFDTYVFIDESEIKIDGKIPLKNLYRSKANIALRNIPLANERFSAKASLYSIYENENYASSSFSVGDISYGQKSIEDFVYNMTYNKNIQMLALKNIGGIENAFGLNVYFAKDAPDFAKGDGYIPIDILILFLGDNIINPLSSIYLSYSAKKTDGIFTHYIAMNSKTVYTLENIMTLDMTLDKENINVKNLYYKLGSDSAIEANASMYKTASNSWKLATHVNTPVGIYEAEGSFVKNKNATEIYLSAISNSLEAKGAIRNDGVIDININTKEDVNIKDFLIGADVEIKKTPEQTNALVKGNIRVRAIQDVIGFNLKSDFEVSGSLVAFTNIYYENRGYIMNGSARVENENGINTIECKLIERNDGGGALALNATVNKNNVFATVGVAKLPLSAFISKGNFDGELYAMATIIGDIKKPAIILDNCSLINFDASSYRFNISLSGNYSDKKLSVQNAVIEKIGANGTYIPQTKEEKITISDLFFSEERQHASVNVRNFSLVSTFDGKIDYTMDIDEYNQKNYNLHVSSLKVNKKKWPTFSTWAIEDNQKIVFNAMTSHGINGVVRKLDNSFALDLNYIFANIEKLNFFGNVNGRNIDVDVSSKTLGIEIFEFFTVLFKKIESKPDFFEKDGENYSLYANVVGDIANLMVYGRFKGKGEVKTTYFTDKFTDSEVDILFLGNVLKINTIALRSKKRDSALVFRGDANFIGNTLENMDFNLKTESKEFNVFLLPDRGPDFLDANADIKILKIRGLTKLDLDITGAIKEPAISGDITIEKNDVQLKIGGENRYDTPINGILNNVMWDLNIHAVSRVQISYNLLGDAYIEDGSSLKVYNSVANGIELDGNINLTRGTIYYIQNAYTIEEGNVLFLGVNSLDPLINMRAYTKRRYVGNGSQYDVTLYMEILNARASSLVSTIATTESPIRFYTVPALDAYQVNELAGVSSSMFEAQGRNNAPGVNEAIFSEQTERIFVSYSDLLLRNVVLRPVERWFRKFFGIDYVTVDTGLINELLFNRDQPLEAKTVNNYFNNTKVSFGKYITRDLFVKYGVTYEGIPSLSSVDQNIYRFNQEFGLEVTLLRDLRLANLIFEYKIHPFELQKQQEFNITTRWRF